VRVQVAAGVTLLLAYWAIYALVPPPAGFSATVVAPDGLLHDWVDRQLLGNHMYRERPDPEGLLSTLPAIATVLAGALTGHWLRSPRERSEKLIGLFVAGNILLLVGLWWGLSFPINKKIWTSSYVLTTAGVALQVLGMCYWLIDIRGIRAWATPLIIFGSNAIVVYVASSLTAKWLAITHITPDGPTYKSWIFDYVFASTVGQAFGPTNASLAFALTYVAIWLIPLYVLYRARIFVKI
jgi:predicted acyltransferase